MELAEGILFVLILPCLTSIASKDAKQVAIVPKKDRVTEYILTSQSNACRKSYEVVPERESYRISASGLSGLKCTMRFKDLELAILRMNQQLNPGEELRLKGRSFEFTILSNSSQYKCYVLASKQPIDIVYTKSSNVRPALDFMLTEANSHDDHQQRKDYDVSCLIDGCTFSDPSINLHYVYIDGDWECDSYQQCPYGEDERCGSIPTNTPETERTTIPPGTSVRPTYPPHITPILISPEASYCFSDGSTLYDFGEYIVTSHIDRQWSGKCSISFADRNQDDHDEVTLLTFRGKLSDGENLIISDKAHTIRLDKSAYEGECLSVVGSFKVVYDTNRVLTSTWMLLITPIDCDEDDVNDCEMRCVIDRCFHDTSSLCRGSGCIDDDNVCDGYAQCPFGEDEQCGTVTSAPVTHATTRTSTSRPRPPALPPLGPISSYVQVVELTNRNCYNNNYLRYKNTETIIYSGSSRDNWRPHELSNESRSVECRVNFEPITATSRKSDYTLGYFVGETLSGETLELSDSAGLIIFIDSQTPSGICFVLEKWITMVYKGLDNDIRTWQIALTPIEHCIDDDDDDDDCDMPCKLTGCRSQSLKCRFGGCIDDRNKCNKIQQCPRGEDEKWCYPTESSLSGGAIAGIVIAAILAVAAISVSVFIFVKKSKSDKQQAATSLGPVPSEMNISDFPDLPYVYSKTKAEGKVERDDTAENLYEMA